VEVGFAQVGYDEVLEDDRGILETDQCAIVMLSERRPGRFARSSRVEEA
jgi:hypothetical protein